MSFKEFGTLVEKAPANFQEFGEKVEEPSRLRSLLSAFPKGVTKEVADIYELFQKVPLPKGEANPEAIRKFAEEKFPTQEKGAEKLLERAGRIAPGALLSPGGSLVKGAQIAGGAILGQGAEEAGLPSWAQAIAESLPFFYAGGKKIPLKQDQKRLGEFLRNQGLTEHEIAPLLKTPEQIATWSKFAEKGEKSRKLMESIYQKSGHIYDTIEQSAKGLPPISSQAAQDFLQEATKIMNSMPHKYRSLIKHDALDLIKGGGHFNDFTNFYRDVNAVIGAEHGGRAIVGQFKGPINKALKSISPQLAEDFSLATDLYRTRANVKGSILSRKQVDDFIDLGEIYGLASAVVNRDFGLMGKLLGIDLGRKMAREMLINPSLQNKSVRIGEALKKNKLTLAEKLMREFSQELSKDDPELASKISEIN